MTTTLEQYHWRRLTPAQAAAIRAAFRTGRGTSNAAALAAAYGVSVRTIYRTVERAAADAYRVEIGSWYAVFELTDDGPRQVTSWCAT